MTVIKTKINSINNEDTKLIIYCNNCTICIPIIDGSYDILIKNTDNDIINIKYLKKDKKFIYPIKIIVNTKYVILEELSDNEK